MADNVIVRVPEQQFIRGEDGYSPEVTIENINHGHSVNITDREHPEGQSFDVLDGASAYEQAVAGGYTGTEAQFNEELASFKELSDETKEAAPFYAEYGVTTKAEIEAAINGKRQIYAYQSLSPYPPILPYVGKIHYDDEQGSGTGYRFSIIEGTTQIVYELMSTWVYYTNDLSEPAQRAEAAAATALTRMNSAAASAQAAATTATTFTEQTVPAAVSTINEAKADALTAVGNAQTTAVGAVQQESTTQQAAIQQKGDDVLESIPSDYTELSGDVDDLKSANDYVIKTKAPDTFEAVPFLSSGGFVKGRINTTTGGNVSSTTRARRYNSILSGNYVSLGTDDYEYTLFYYDGIAGAWTDTYTHVYSDWINGSVWTLIDDSIGDRARIIVRHPDDSEISDADLDILTRVCVARNLNQITPQITTKKGNPVYIGELEALARDWYSHRNDIVGGSKAMVYGNNSILNTSSYTREIDCSTFVGMLLRGYSFSQTPYATGQGANPDSWTGNTAYNWTFNPFDYSNYSRIDSQSRTKVRYASQMAEMMIERGQTVPIDRYYANIEPGDVLFFARHDSTTNDWFEPLRLKHINHVAICIAKEKATSAGGWDTTTFPWKHTFIEVGHEDETTPDGVIKIRTLEQPQGDTSAIFDNNINTLCLVCRPDLGSI